MNHEVLSEVGVHDNLDLEKSSAIEFEEVSTMLSMKEKI